MWFTFKDNFLLHGFIIHCMSNMLFHFINECLHFCRTFCIHALTWIPRILIMTMLVPVWSNPICSRDKNCLPSFTYTWLVLDSFNNVAPTFTIPLMSSTRFIPCQIHLCTSSQCNYIIYYRAVDHVIFVGGIISYFSTLRRQIIIV